MTSLVDARCNQRVRELLGPTFVFHDLRSIYGQMAWRTYNPQGISLTAYISQILGHSETSISTALSYQTFVIQQSLKQDDPTLVAKINNLQAEFDLLKEVKREPSPTHPPQPELKEKKGQGPKEVKFFTPNKAKELVLSIQKEPRRRDGTANKLLRLESAAGELQRSGVPLTYRNLLKLGFGKRIVSQWFKIRKAAVAETRAAGAQVQEADVPMGAQEEKQVVQ